VMRQQATYIPQGFGDQLAEEVLMMINPEI
jgi:hypothetical protein